MHVIVKSYIKSSFTGINAVTHRGEPDRNILKNGWMPELQQRYIIPWITHSLHLCTHTHTHTLPHVHPHTHMFTFSQKPKCILIHTHNQSSTIPLCWSHKSVPFLRGALPATNSTLPVCDPWMCWKRKCLTYYPFLLMLPISSYVEYGPCTVNASLYLWGKCWKNVAVRLWKLRHLKQHVCSVDLVFFLSVSFYSHLQDAMDSFLLWRSIRENINLLEWHLIPSLGR